MFSFRGSVIVSVLAVTSCGGGDDPGTPAGSGGGSGGSAGATGGNGGAPTGGAAGTPSGGSSGSGGSGGSAGADGGPCVDRIQLPLFTTPPAKLSETGLYSEIASKTVAPYVQSFQPQFVLWSDGAEKARYVYLPECSQIDTSDMDHWQMPVGARFWKQFTRDGVLVETRLIHRFGPGSNDWIFAAYQWNTGGDADLVPGGVQNANGTTHDIPSQAQCKQCHSGLEEKILGFGAIQLSHSLSGETMATLSAAGRLTVPNAAGFSAPGNSEGERAALGYLHANCGNCHNSTGLFPDMRLRLLIGDKSVPATDTYTTAVSQPTVGFDCLGTGSGTCDRIEPGDAASSAVIMRMSVRQVGVQMPPLGTEVVDDTGVATVSTWINAL